MKTLLDLTVAYQMQEDTEDEKPEANHRPQFFASSTDHVVNPNKVNKTCE